MVATRIQRYRVDVRGTYSLDTLPVSLLQLMIETDQEVQRMQTAAGGPVEDVPYA